MNSLQIIIGVFTRSAPLRERCDLCWGHFLTDLRIAVLGAKAEALQIFVPSGLAPLGRREENAKPELVGIFIRRAEDLLRLGRERPHSFTAPRSGAYQYEATDQLGLGDRQLLCHEAAQREAKQIDFRQTERLDEDGGVCSHLFNRGGYFA